jgi:hypothetical protein
LFMTGMSQALKTPNTTRTIIWKFDFI